MMIEKNGFYYEITERSRHWSVVKKSAALTVEIQISKEICKTEEEVKAYIEKESIF